MGEKETESEREIKRKTKKPHSSCGRILQIAIELRKTEHCFTGHSEKADEIGHADRIAEKKCDTSCKECVPQ